MKIISSDGLREYAVTPQTLFNDAICDPECQGYMFRGTCRHIREAQEHVCMWCSDDLETELCTLCAKEAVVVEIPEKS